MKKPRYVNEFFDRHGRPRYYFRFRGQRWPLPAPEDPGFAAAYEALKRKAEEAPILPPRNLAFMTGTFGWAIERYLASGDFAALADATQRNHRRVLDILKKDYGAGLLRDMQARHIKTIRNRIRDAHTTTAADIALGLISTIWEFADERLDQDLEADPTVGIRRVHKVSKEHEPWPQWLIDKFIATAPVPLRLAVRLLLFTGQRRSDVVKMKWSQFDGEFIEVSQQKTKELLSIPCHRDLRAHLEAAPRTSEFILVGERGGHGYKAASLSALITRHLRSIGVTGGYSAHGLRKNAGNALAEAGCSTRQIMAVLGHRTYQMAMHYTKRASQRRLARDAFDKWEAAGTKKASER